MNQVTKKQHYIWRKYLAPWTNDNSNTGKIACLRDNKIFVSSLMNVAHENYFYKVKRLSKQEKELIYLMTISDVTGTQKSVNEGWLNLYCAPFDLADEIDRFNTLTDTCGKVEESQKFKDLIIEHIENIHCSIEMSVMEYLEQLKRGDINFWKDEESRDKFSFYLCNQYFRTKRSRDAIIWSFEQCRNGHEHFKSICPNNMWLPLSLIYASNVGAHIAQDFSAVLLQAEDDSFIVGDQPVANTFSTFNGSIPPNDIELFYPITPKLALLLTKKSGYVSGQAKGIDVEEVKKYNLIEFKSSREQVFAKDATQLKDFSNVVTNKIFDPV